MKVTKITIVFVGLLIAFAHASTQSKGADNKDIKAQIPTLLRPINNSVINELYPRFVWNNSSSDSLFEVQIASDSLFSIVLDSAYVTDTVYTIITLLQNGIFYWRVQAYDTAGQWSGYSDVWSFQRDTLALPDPILISPDNNVSLKNNKPLFEWELIPTATNYRISIASDSVFADIIDTATVDSAYYTEQNILTDGYYYWRIKAYRAATDSSRWSRINRFHINADTLVAYYPFNGDAADLSGHEHNGTVYGTTMVNDMFNNSNSAFTFDGVNSYIDIGELGPMMDFTFSLWFKKNTLEGYQTTDNEADLVGSENNTSKHALKIGFLKGINDVVSFTVNTTENVYKTVSAEQIINDTLIWHNIVVTREDSVLRTYLDGKSNAVYFSGLGNPNDTINTGNVYKIGTVGGVDNGKYSGEIDEVKIWHRVLTPSEIDLNYLGYAMRVLRPTQNETIEDTAINIIWNRVDSATYYIVQLSHYPFFDSIIISNNTNDTSEVISNLAPGTYFARVCAYHETAQCRAWSTIVRFNTDTLVLTDSTCVAHYPLDNSSCDVSGNGHHGYVWGAKPTMNHLNQIEKAYSFDGVNNYIDCGDLGDINDYTVSLWFRKAVESYYPWGTVGMADLIGTARNTFWHYQFFRVGFMSEATDHMCFLVSTISNSTKHINTSAPIIDTVWHHLAVTRVGSVMKEYFDGSEAAIYLVESSGNPSDVIRTKTSTKIGTVGGVNDIKYQGDIDDVIIWKRGLSTDEIQNIYLGIQGEEKETGNVFINKLDCPYPNPASASLHISYSLNQEMPVLMVIYNIIGQKIKTLVNENKKPGTYYSSWNLNDAQGKHVANGIYFVRITAGSFNDTKRICVIQ